MAGTPTPTAAYAALPSATTDRGTAAVGPRRLTPRQATMFRWIGEYVAAHVRPPAFRDICERFGITSPNGVVAILRALEKKGVLRLNHVPQGTGRSTARGVEVVGLAELIGPLVRAHVESLITGDAPGKDGGS